MLAWIEAFIAEKNLSKNTSQSYFYDLQQFEAVVGQQVTDSKLRLYELSLADLKISAKKRKISVVNQFLYFLYENEQVKRFYRLENKERLEVAKPSLELLDLDFWQVDTSFKNGQLVALLILELGLSPSEISLLLIENFDLDFHVLTVKSSSHHRVLSLSEKFLEHFADLSGTYLFDNHGKPYSRQWLFNQLGYFLKEQNLGHLNAQKLREQYILRQREAGLSSFAIAKNLGLKSQVTLEKYFKSDGY